MFGENKVDLVYKAKKENGRAFTKLIEENLKSIYRVAKGILKNEEDIEDAIQNTILSAFSNIKTLRKDGYHFGIGFNKDCNIKDKDSSYITLCDYLFCDSKVIKEIRIKTLSSAIIPSE